MVKRIRRKRLWLVVIALAVSACGRRGTPPAVPHHVRVAAASDLNAALGELLTNFRASHDIVVDVVYGSSGTFYTQLLNHAPFDLFLSADIDYPKQLAARGLTVTGSEFTYAVGRLVLWTPVGSAVGVAADGKAATERDQTPFTLSALLEPSVSHVAIANPEHAPYGRAAVAALQRAGLYERVRPKIVYGENVAQALQFVQSGAADAGLVALSLALAPAVERKGRWVEVPLSTYPRMEQGGTILQWAADVASAQALRSFMLGAGGRALLKQYGFFLPGE